MIEVDACFRIGGGGGLFGVGHADGIGDGDRGVNRRGSL